MSIYEDLVNQYDLGKRMMDNGENVNKLELMFIGYALDAVDTAKRNFKTELNFTEDSIKDVENILGHLHKTIPSSKPSNDLILDFAKQFAGYIGQVIKLNWGGEWKDERDYSIKNGPALKVKTQNLFLLSKVYRRIISGTEDNVWHFYQVIKGDIEEGNENKEVKVEEIKTKEKKENFFLRLFGR